MKKLLAAVLAVCTIVSLFPSSAQADDSTLGGTGITVFPIYDTDVVMEEEIINIIVKDDKVYVDCQFFFHNTGDAVDLLVGFPARHPGIFDSADEYETSQSDIFSEDSDLYWFRTFINGKRVPVRIKKGLEPDGNNQGELYFPIWHTWNMHFAENQRIKVVNRYYMDLGYGGENSAFFDYILQSGATWKDSIGKVTVRIQFVGLDDPTSIHMSGIAPTYIEPNDTILFQAENLEPAPEDDIQISFDWIWNDDLDSPFEYNTPEYDQYHKMGVRLLRNFNAHHYNGTTWWGDQFISAFGSTQSDEFYYITGMSYYMKKRYTKALDRLSLVSSDSFDYYTSALYFKALAYSKLGMTEDYISCLNELEASCTVQHGTMWLQLWARSRLADLEAGS